MNKNTDQSFDAIIDKFANNIYGSTKGQLRHELLLHYLQQYINLAERSLDIIDVGGGTGIMCEALAKYNHRLTYNDISEQAVLLAKSNLAQLSNIEFNCGSLTELPDSKHYDLLICHAVLEWLVSPFEAIEKMLSMVRVGGVLSISFFNQDAHRFGNLLYGNFDYVEAGLKNKNTVRLNPNNALKPAEVLSYLSEKSVEVIHTAGIRWFHDYLQDRSMQQSRYQQIKSLELEYGTREPYKWLGKYFHIILRRTA
ncbi:methyltransferase domain-containing protein [Aliiglaciecola sp. LCG003]|uniref:methyltransferase domain-containing protein n=1 Tax=Aliiglaciecola sp. LCG003 TaxID=3053655 RepID=UPI002572B86B|nr:methyltransferase domain-containing protein [Aliiglaciecola sp. LCG003]WJG07868.1 methyltransferase domain-containing protein [Aliiglaciecola sp. LCG003]